MKKGKVILAFTLIILTLIPSMVWAQEEACVTCHKAVTPGIVEQWKLSEHWENEVTCSSCHTADSEDPSGFEHAGTTVTAVVSPNYCSGCHEAEVEEYTASKHAWTAFIGPLKPWYQEMVSQGKDPHDPATAMESNPRDYVKDLVTPLFPDSGALERAGLLDSDEYFHENQVLGCMECHGTYVIAEDGVILEGWPNNGVGRVNPDGSLGSCSSCHTRHAFSVEEARKPETCGQCHMGPDHPQIEIYEESKHGNIYASLGESWDWEDVDWGPEDLVAPTCATCHMSGFGGVVETTHDAGARLYWELQPKKSVPQWDDASLVPLGQQSSDLELAESGRAEMEAVCNVCHSSAWTEGYMESFDKVISDYNMVYDYTYGLLQAAYDEELIRSDNPIDETIEVMYYYIWHHDGRRWRMGASMMGPDWTHWGGAVDALLDKLNTMEEWIDLSTEKMELDDRVLTLEHARYALESRAEEAEQSAQAASEDVAELEMSLSDMEQAIAALEEGASNGGQTFPMGWTMLFILMVSAMVVGFYVMRRRP